MPELRPVPVPVPVPEPIPAPGLNPRAKVNPHRYLTRLHPRALAQAYAPARTQTQQRFLKQTELLAQADRAVAQKLPLQVRIALTAKDFLGPRRAPHWRPQALGQACPTLNRNGPRGTHPAQPDGRPTF